MLAMVGFLYSELLERMQSMIAMISMRFALGNASAAVATERAIWRLSDSDPARHAIYTEPIAVRLRPLGVRHRTLAAETNQDRMNR